MSKDYETKSSGGLMDDIQALIAPPGEEKKKREGLDLHPYFRRPGRGHNRDRCDSCGEGGDLLCCDRCPASFHLGCHDPPIPEEEIPSGDWICHNCKATEALKLGAAHRTVARYDAALDGTSCSEALAMRSPLQQLIQAASLLNPKQFELPPEMVVNDVLPGQPKTVQKGSGNKKKPYELDNGLVPLPAKLCYKCNKSCRVAPLIACDYCSCCFHMDCLDPPLTTVPSGAVWMCPLHVENFLDSTLLTSSRLTERLKLWNKFSGPIDQDVVKLNFLKRVHCKHPPFRRKVRIKNENLVEVPEAVKSHYRNPFPAPTEMVRGDNVPDCSVRASEEEQELWLKSVVSMQLAASREMTHRTVATLDTEIKLEPKSEPNTEDTENMEVNNVQDTKPDITTNGTCEHAPLTNSGEPAEPRDTHLDSILKTWLTEADSGSHRPSSGGRGTPERRQLYAQLVAAGCLDLSVLDERLVQLLAVQRLQQLMGAQAACRLAPRAGLDPQKCAGSLVKPRATLTPLGGLGSTEYLRYRSVSIGSGAHNHINLDTHGFCQFVSGQHATIFFDEGSHRFELLNYSEHGTVVDGVLYACNFSECTVAAGSPDSGLESAVRGVADKQRQQRDAADDGSAVMSQEPCVERLRCHCLCPQAGPADAPRRGFEASALVQHGSLLQMGCLKFVFAEQLAARPPQQESVVQMLQERRRQRHGGENAKQSDGTAPSAGRVQA